LSRMFERVGKTPTASFEDLAEILLAMSMSLSLPSPMTPDRRPRPHTAEMLLVVLRGFLATGLPLTAAAQEVVAMPR
jgi:hypothetical protein